MAQKKRKSSKKPVSKNKNDVGGNFANKREEKLWQLELKQEKRKKRLFITTPILMVLVIIGLIVVYKSTAKIEIRAHSITSFYDTSANETVFVADGKALSPRIAGSTTLAQGTLDGDLLCEMTESGDLVLTSLTETKIIAGGITDFALAAGGSHILYTTVNQLFIYDVKTATAASIAGADGASELRISPDGSAFAYVRDSYAWMGTKEGAYSVKDCVPVSISNGGEYVYAISTVDSSLVSIDHEGTPVLLVLNVDTDGDFIINSTGTQLICRTHEGPYIITNGVQVDKFGGAGQSVPAISWDSYAVSPEGRVKTLNTDTLFGLVYNSFYKGKYSLYGVNSNGASKLQWEGSDSPYHIRSDNSSAYYIEDDALYYARNSNRGNSKSTLIDSGVSELHISSDGERIFYLTNYGQLKVVEARKTSKVIAENVTAFAADYNKGAFYIGNEGTLYRYDGRKSVQLLEGVASVQALPGMTLCYATVGDGLCNVYAAAPKGSFELVAEAVIIN